MSDDQPLAVIDTKAEVVNPVSAPSLSPKPMTLEESIRPEMAALIPTAGTLVLTDAQKEVLYSPVDQQAVEVRPDGLIYLPWMEYADRMDRAFGGTGWTMVPDGMPRMQYNQVIWGFFLVICGKFMGYAIGGQEYYPNNDRMTYADAMEGAKSNALMRLCKGIGITKELWRPSFLKAWKDKYAESYEGIVRNQKKTLWRKRGEPIPSPSPKADDGIDDTPAPRTPLTVNLTFSDGKPHAVTMTQAMQYLEDAKKRLGEAEYRKVLGSCGYENKHQLAHNPSEMSRVWDALITTMKEKA